MLDNREVGVLRVTRENFEAFGGLGGAEVLSAAFRGTEGVGGVVSGCRRRRIARWIG